MKDSLTIKALKYISKQNGEYKFIELKKFILDNFENKPDFLDRYEILSFLRFLTKSELIEMESITNGLHFLVENNREIPREEISAKAKITSKGFDLIRENDKHIKNNISFYLSIFFGLSTVFLGWKLYFENPTRENLKVENVQLKAENALLKDLNLRLNFETKKGIEEKEKKQHK